MIDMTLHHLGYVVRDLEEAARRWYDLAGVGPFLVLDHVHFDTLTVDGRPATFDHSAAFAAHGDVFLEIQRVHDANPAAAAAFFRAGEAPALHHLAYVADDPAVTAAHLRDRGIPQTVTASAAGLSIAQYDVRASLGFAVEIHPRTDEFVALFAKVRAAADGWDRSAFLRPFG
jgi:glyoxalase/bleomycin resistance protein/dioxygenase superfamily protein